MRILMISLDRTLLDPSSRSAARIARYAEAAGEVIVIVPRCSLGKVVSFLFRPERVDLVTAQDPFWTGTIAYLLSRRAGVPLEIQLHGDLGNESWIRRQWALWMIRRADGIRVVSERLRRRLVEFGIKAEQIYKIPIGLDSPSPFPLPPCLTAGRRGERVGERVPGFETIFTYVGSLNSGKGVDLLIKAFAKVAEGNRRALLQIVGDGPERHRLEELALRLELRTYVRFLGFMNDPRPVIAASDALVLPSWSEGWGRAPVEALAAGVPVIMTDVGLAGEVVRNNENGLVVAKGSVDGMRDALARFAGDGNLRERLRAGAHSSRDHLPKFSDTVTAVVDVWKKITVCQSRQTDSQRPHRNTILFIFLLALAARLIMFGLIQARGTEFFYRFSDGNEYLVVARNLLAGNGFSVRSQPPFVPYEYYTPGYPLILAGTLAVGLGPRAVILFQVLAGAATAAMIAFWGRYLVGRRSALLGGLLLALEPSTIFWNNQLVTETVSTLFLIGSFFALVAGLRLSRLRNFLVSGFLLGLSILVRHAAEFLIWIFPFVALLAYRGSLLRRCAAATLCFILAVILMAPWVIRNHIQFGSWFYSTASGAIGLGKTLRDYTLRTVGTTIDDIIPYEEYERSNENTIQDSNNMWRAWFVVLRHDPIGLARVYVKSLIPFFFGDGYAQIRIVAFGSSVPEVLWDRSSSSLWNIVVRRPDAIQFILGKVVWVFITACAALGAIRHLRVRERRAGIILALCMIAYYAIGAGVGGYSRFRFPVNPLMLLFAGAGMVFLKEYSKRNQEIPRDQTSTMGRDMSHGIGPPYSSEVTYSFIIPALNEEATIRNAIERTRSYAEGLGVSFEVIVVNDGSSDKTSSIVRELASRDSRIHLIEFPTNMGKGAAVRAGMLAARGEWRIFLDADLSTVPEEFEWFRTHLVSNDIIIGSRGLRESRILIHQPPLRELSGRLFNVAVRGIVGLPFRDTQCGFKAFHARTVDLFKTQMLHGWVFDVELLATAMQCGFRIAEVPITWKNDPHSTVRLSHAFRTIADLLRIRRNR